MKAVEAMISKETKKEKKNLFGLAFDIPDELQ
jgi:hypothetical protein